LLVGGCLWQDAQKRKDDREYLLRKLTNTNTFVDLYDPAKADLVPRVKQGISTDLSDILRKHPRAELAEVMKREPDVCGMVVSLGEHLHAKGIRSAEASQILAALP
jgi:hypothetical protein